jgi:hypothetical protein
MFKLFGKKKEEATAEETQTQQNPEVAQLSAQFQEDEFNIIAVTGANSFGGEEEKEGGERVVTLPLIAWREGDGPVQEEDTCLVAVADDNLLEYLQRLAPRDSVIQAKVRQGLEDDRFLLVGMPAPIVDRELKALLDERTKEVSTWVSGLGTFVLNRRFNWFQTELDWLEQNIQVIYDNGSEEDMKAAQQTALTMVEAKEKWDETIRAFAASTLAQTENEEEELNGLDEAELSRRLEIESIQVWADGRFEVWFHDGDYLWEHSVRVNGSLSEGPGEVHLEG